MFLRFSKQRQKKYFRQLAVWSVGMFVIVPLAIFIFPYLIDMPYESYSSSFSDLLYQGGVVVFLILWSLGAFASFLMQCLNLPTEEEKQDQADDIDRSIEDF